MWSGEHTCVYRGAPSGEGGSTLHEGRINKIGLHVGGGRSSHAPLTMGNPELGSKLVFFKVFQ